MSDEIITPNLPALQEQALTMIEAMSPEEMHAVLDYMVGLDILMLMNAISNMQREKATGQVGRHDPIESPLRSDTDNKRSHVRKFGGYSL